MSLSDRDARPVPASDLLRWSEALSGIARTGLGFTDNLYERERFEEVLRVAADIRVAAGLRGPNAEAGLRGPNAEAGLRGPNAEAGLRGPNAEAGLRGPNAEAGLRGATADSHLDAHLVSEALVEQWIDQVGRGVEGYVTPKVAVGAVVGNDVGQILLVQRADSGVWLYPTGWADVGYSASEVAVKEVHEETGIQVEPVRLIAVLDGLRLGFHRIPLYSLVFHCRMVAGDVRVHPLECLDAGWFSEDGLPQPLAGDGRWTAHAFGAIRGEPVDVFFDPPRDPPWRRKGEGP